jgi:xanthine dehydrogenase YagR molybdenum-binding subunit
MAMGQDQQQKPVGPPPQMAHRYDGVAKVTGKAKYAAEFREPFDRKQLVYAFIVQSTIPNGTIRSIDTTVAERAPGVLKVLTPFNAPKLSAGPPKPPARRNLSLLQDADVHYNGQPIALVVAESLVQAQAAARMLKISYAPKPAKLDFRGRLGEAHLPGNPGKDPAVTMKSKLDEAMAKATTFVDNTYITPIQNHNPMEPHATVAWWDGDHLTVYDSTQYITGCKMSLAKAMNLPLDFVHVECPYTGGGFGSKGSMWSHVPLAAMAAKVSGRPVQLAMERTQMFGPVGARPSTVNHIKLGATSDGKLLGIQHDVVVNASVMEAFVEHAENPSKMLYAHEAAQTSAKVVDVNYGISTFMRAPGEAPGTAVLEIAMDELAEKLNMDPLQLRLVNYAEKDPAKGLPWTSKHLREAYQQASERFGWSKRNAKPGTMVEGNKMIGYGMATATYPANRSAAMAAVRAMPDGRVWVGSGTQDLGTGTYTIMAQTVAQSLKMDPTMVDVKLGDSTLPKAPVSGGSQSAASLTPAIADACKQLTLKLVQMAISDSASPLHGLNALDVSLKAGVLTAKDDATNSTRGRQAGGSARLRGAG